MVRRCALGDGGRLGAVERTGWVVGVVGIVGWMGCWSSGLGFGKYTEAGDWGRKKHLPLDS